MHFFPTQSATEHLEFPVLYSRFLLVIHWVGGIGRLSLTHIIFISVFWFRDYKILPIIIEIIKYYFQ